MEFFFHGFLFHKQINVECKNVKRVKQTVFFLVKAFEELKTLADMLAKNVN